MPLFRDKKKEKISKHIHNYLEAYRDEELPINWEEVKYLLTANEDEAREEIKQLIKRKVLKMDTTYEDYLEVYEEIKLSEQNSEDCMEESYSSIIVDPKVDNGTITMTDEKSCWMLYKNMLLNEKNFSDTSVTVIEKETERIRKRLSSEYIEDVGSIKGMVVGAVQSGKTANMGALIAQCADNGWNCFIILGGMIDNLRKQTENRLISDLSRNGYCHWTALNTICNKSADMSQEVQKLKIGEDSNERYLAVVLKNKTRLQNLLNWIKRGSSASRNLRILVIDDEADQASVNTADISKDEKKAIYKLIDELVNGTAEKKKRVMRCGGMNYVCYTATPYANFLNDSDAKSLYPNNFIATLSPSRSYFGPQQIFGIADEDYPGMSIIRDVSEEDGQAIKDICSSDSMLIPESLKRSIAWFICCVATMRYQEMHKPFSMLVNVSQKVDDHAFIAEAIEKWFKSTKTSKIVELCKNVWNEETKEFNLDTLKLEVPKYELLSKVEDYPDFEEIRPCIYSIVDEQIKHINLNDSNGLEYGSGIHLCIDNSKNNKAQDDEYLRLVYPSSEQLKDMLAPAFLVVGGNTLSRGLTIEGLVSTYFLRKGKQVDTLMQMGRWFGYRIGYELYPRIWMDENTVEQFEFISQLDFDLRMNLFRYMFNNVSPREVGVLINNTPKVSWLRITAKMKMQSAIEAQYDYCGMQTQTIAFDDDYSTMKHNIILTKKFINGMGVPRRSRTKTSYVWKDINTHEIVQYLKKFRFCSNNRVLNDIDTFTQWLEDDAIVNDFGQWNVVLVSIGRGKEWGANDNVVIHKVNRSRKLLPREFINIGVLRSYRDNYEDICFDEIDDATDEKIKKMIDEDKPKDFHSVKEALGFKPNPLLAIYIIDGKSKTESENRESLNLEEDLVGLYINVPGEKKYNPVSQITVKLPKRSEEDDYA